MIFNNYHKFTRLYPVRSTYELTKQFDKICVKNYAIDLKKNNLYLGEYGPLIVNIALNLQSTKSSRKTCHKTLLKYFALDVLWSKAKHLKMSTYMS